ncbi:solute-binding protein family 3/N-terminal domain of MltF [Artemisia annua]|uniref:Solute-binding protein family 3/N-terminal domain of MltF n=1 Tax=Artemisia annua TaxID=35608 RepID=A0A2U1L7K3_ARTAN|nr:solute-binding protein family 3/N-terminal domain of MltF [Artemisia annua]
MVLAGLQLFVSLVSMYEVAACLPAYVTAPTIRSNPLKEIIRMIFKKPSNRYNLVSLAIGKINSSYYASFYRSFESVGVNPAIMGIGPAGAIPVALKSAVFLLVIVWMFVVLVLTSSYTESLTSILTIQQLRPAYTNISEIKDKGESIGYQEASFVVDILNKMNFDDSMLKSYNTFEQIDTALKKGSRNGGSSAILDELPYISKVVDRGFKSNWLECVSLTQ